MERNEVGGSEAWSVDLQEEEQRGMETATPGISFVSSHGNI